MPLGFGGEMLGVLDIHWKGTHPPSETGVLPHHSEAQLYSLGQRVAGALQTRLLRMLDEQARLAKEQAMRAVNTMHGYLVNNIHDLRNNVAELGSCIRLLGQDEKIESQWLGAARKNIGELKERLNNAIDQGKVLRDTDRSLDEPYSVLEHVVRNALSRCPQASIRLEASEVARTFRMPMNGEQIENCFRYLVDNVVKLIVSNPDVSLTVEVSAKEDGRTLLFRFCDNGPGFPPHVVRAVQRVDTVEKTEGGMGLYMAQLFSNLHGGSLAIESPGPGGTVVELVLRREETEVAR